MNKSQPQTPQAALLYSYYEYKLPCLGRIHGIKRAQNMCCGAGSVGHETDITVGPARRWALSLEIPHST